MSLSLGYDQDEIWLILVLKQACFSLKLISTLTVIICCFLDLLGFLF